MKVIAKFRCNSIELYSKEPDGTKRVKLSPVSNGTSEEDKMFWKYTPSGLLEMTIDNPSAANMFEIGQFYYVTFEPVGV